MIESKDLAFRFFVPMELGITLMSGDLNLRDHRPASLNHTAMPV